MNMHPKYKNGRLAGIMWILFSATAMLSAIILPIHIAAIGMGFKPLTISIWTKFYFFALYEAALYHSLYRVKTIVFDIGITKWQKLLNITLILIFAAATVLITKIVFAN